MTNTVVNGSLHFYLCVRANGQLKLFIILRGPIHSPKWFIVSNGMDGLDNMLIGFYLLMYKLINTRKKSFFNYRRLFRIQKSVLHYGEIYKWTTIRFPFFSSYLCGRFSKYCCVGFSGYRFNR